MRQGAKAAQSDTSTRPYGANKKQTTQPDTAIDGTCSETASISTAGHKGHFLGWGIEDVGSVLRGLNGEVFSQMAFSTAKDLQQRERRGPYGLRLRYSIHFFITTRRAVVVAPEPLPPDPGCNLDRGVQLLRTTPATLQSSGGRKTQWP